MSGITQKAIMLNEVTKQVTELGREEVRGYVQHMQNSRGWPKNFIKERTVYNENDFNLLNIDRTKLCKIHGPRVDEAPLVFAVPGYIKRYRNP